MNRYLVTILLVALSYFYLYPGLNLALSGNTELVMSDGTDPAGAPFQYESVLNVWSKHPSYLFYGSVYSEDLNPEQGAAYWMSWSEKWTVILTSYFLPLEQISMGVVFFLTIFTGLSMYALARYLKWNSWISTGLAIAWAFSAYMRARAKVHMSMTGIYHLPLLFLGLFLMVRGKTKKSLMLAALCFLLTVTTVHYYIITTAFLTPFFIAFIFLQKEFSIKTHWVRLTATIPAILFLAFNFIAPIPSGVKMNAANSVPQSGATEDGSAHPFLTYYASHPIDYLTGDIALENIPSDLNPLRFYLNKYVRENMTEGNPHERTNGIRWSILLLGIFGVFLALKKTFKNSSVNSLDPDSARNILFFAALAFFGFWLSLPPDTPFPGWGPSGWLYHLVNQVRVTSRAGIIVHFSFLMIVGFLLASRIELKKYRWLPMIFPILMVLDYPPRIQDLPVSTIAPASKNINADNSEICGPGLYIPYISAWTDVAYYTYLQRLRGTRCTTINAAVDPYEIRWLSERFPPRGELISAMLQSPQTMALIQKMAACVPLDWLMFDKVLPVEWSQAVCDKLGWKFFPDLTCVNPSPRKTFEKWPSRCAAY